MAIDRKLDVWIAAGLIDAAAADGIRAFEEKRERPYALWAIIGLGLLALALGIMLIVAANWDQIADWAKLAVQLLLTSAAAAAVWSGGGRARLWQSEVALFVLGALVLAGIALQAQIYQLGGPLWQALLLWLVLMTPALLVLGRTRVTGYGWSLMLLWAAGAFVTDFRKDDWLLVEGAALAMPALLVLLSLLPSARGASFSTALREIGIIALLGGASFAHFAWAERVSAGDAAEMMTRSVLPIIMAAAAVWAGRRWSMIPSRLLLPLLAGPSLAVLLALSVPHENGMLPRLFGAIVFAAMWGAVAAAASASGWRALFGVAIAAIAIRIFIIYFELFGTLATTGAGLIAGGILLIALALGWRRIFRAAGDGQ